MVCDGLGWVAGVGGVADVSRVAGSIHINSIILLLLLFSFFFFLVFLF
jgi:hypothetical protein